MGSSALALQLLPVNQCDLSTVIEFVAQCDLPDSCLDTGCLFHFESRKQSISMKDGLLFYPSSVTV